MDIEIVQKALARVFDGAETAHFKRHEIIVRPEIEPSGVFYIQEGFIKIYDIDSEGRYNLVSVRGPAGIFPFEWALHQNVSALYYEAMGNVALKRISREKFMAAIEQDPKLAIATLRLSLFTLNSYMERIQHLEQPTVRQRLASLLLFFTERFSMESPEGKLLNLPLNYQDIADSINTTRDTVNREVLKLKKFGLINCKNRQLYIKSEEALEELLNSGNLPAPTVKV
jgi:CRP-like cAMP-binding protein